MSYLQDKKTRNKKIAYSVLLLFFVFVVSYYRTPIFSGFSSLAAWALHPIVSLGEDAGESVSDSKIFFISKESLAEENDKLKESLDEANAKMQNYDALSKENAELKEILRRNVPKKDLLLAGILGKPKDSIYGTIVLDAGAAEGASVGDRVFAYGDLPIGRISEADSHSSKVILYSSPGEKTEAILGGSYFILEGRGGGDFEVTTPRDFPLVAGDEAVLPGITPYLMARVEGIISDPRDSFQKALLSNPVNIEELKFVEIESR